MLLALLVSRVPEGSIAEGHIACCRAASVSRVLCFAGVPCFAGPEQTVNEGHDGQRWTIVLGTEAIVDVIIQTHVSKCNRRDRVTFHMHRPSDFRSLCAIDTARVASA